VKCAAEVRAGQRHFASLQRCPGTGSLPFKRRHRIVLPFVALQFEEQLFNTTNVLSHESANDVVNMIESVE
jgi:hypothetical protein